MKSFEKLRETWKGGESKELSTVAKIAASTAAMTAIWATGVDLYARSKVHFGYSIAITSGDDLYYEVQRWVTEELGPKRARAMVANIRWGESKPLLLKYDGSREQFIKIDGHRIAITVKSEQASNTSIDLMREYRPKMSDKIVLTAFSSEGREALLAMLTKLSEDVVNQRNDSPDLWVWGKQGWQHAGSLHPRPISSVILPPEQIERIVHTFEKFVSMEDRYNSLGLPWHLGMLFHGEPGNGKSSIARAIATHFQRNLYYLSLASIKSDEDLLQAVAKMRNNALLLLEDVDTVGAMVNRHASDNGGLSMSAVLNILDGVATPHGLVTIMSTNDIDSLDKAIWRPGRVDLAEYIYNASVNSAKGIFNLAFPEEPPFEVEALVGVITPAEMVGALKPYLDDVTTARHMLTEVCAGRTIVDAIRNRPVATTSKQDDEAVPLDSLTTLLSDDDW